MKRARYVLAAAVIAAVAGGYAYWARGADGSDEGYVTETLARGPVTTSVTATGTVNPVTTVQVGTYVSGPIIALDVDYNTRVRKGQRVPRTDRASSLARVQS